MDPAPDSNYFQKIERCDDCGRRFRIDSPLAMVLNEDWYLDNKEPEEFDIHAGHQFWSILRPFVLCVKCFNKIKKIIRYVPSLEEIDTSYKPDEFMFVLDDDVGL